MTVSPLNSPVFWNEEWNRLVALRRPGPENPESWNRKAPGYRSRVEKSPYTERLLSLLELRNSDSVLDMGAGEGSVTLEIARKVNRVTAVDYSPEMLKLLQKSAGEKGIENVTPVESSWLSEWDAGIGGVHDFFLASRSFLVPDLQATIAKIHKFTRRKVTVVTSAGESAGSSPARKILGKGDAPSPDYILAVNYLYSIGIPCEVRFIEMENTTSYGSREEAFEWLRLSLPDIDRKDEKKLNEYVKEHCREEKGRWILQPRRPVLWAVLSWDVPEKERVK